MVWYGTIWPQPASMLWFIFIIHHTHHSFVNGYGWYGTTLSRLLS